MNDLHHNYIAGEWIGGVEMSKNINPSDVSDVIGEYARADRAQAETAIAAAPAAPPDLRLAVPGTTAIRQWVVAGG